ncbi:MAG: PorT family protein [Fibrobacterota bacterium]|nr:PorT family protein [Fibrobacterota bacterium]
MKIWKSWMITIVVAGLTLDEALAHGPLGGRGVGIFAGPINNFPELEGVEVESRLGGAVGIIAEWGVHGNYSLALEPMVAWRGPSITSGAGYEPDLMLLEIPILARRNWHFRDHNRIFVFAGPNLAFPMSVKGDIAGGTPLEKDDVKAFDFLMDAGLGASVRFALHWHLIGSVRYSHGFTEVLEGPIGGVDEWKSRNVKFLFGIMHHIPGT